MNIYLYKNLRMLFGRLYNFIYVLYCITFVIHMRSHITSLICTVLPLILKFYNGGLVIIFLDRNI
jgi:hypothetical protein